MVTGKVVRFDEVRGYGFVAPEVGGEDVFIHVNDLTFDKRLVAPGVVVEFDLEESDRGPKASHVRIVRQAAERSGESADEDRGAATLVSVHLDGFTGEDAAGQAIDAISGFALVLSSLKVWLEHGIDSQLMYDRFPDAAYSDR